MSDSHRCVAVERVIPAPAEAIFDVLADPDLHPLLDGSGTVRHAWSGNPLRLALGSRFSMAMVYGRLPYPIVNTVVEFEEDRRIAWRHFAGHRWRWELEPIDDLSTRVVHTFDWSTSRWPGVLERWGYPERNAVGMAETLERLESVARSRPHPVRQG